MVVLLWVKPNGTFSMICMLDFAEPRRLLTRAFVVWS
jgi:hypothetical protein